MNLNQILKQALAEDNPRGDITTDLMITDNSIMTAQIIAKEDGVFFGQEIIREIFQIIDNKTQIEILKNDGDILSQKDVIAIFKGNIKSILIAERVMLNFLQRLSGVATTSNKFVKKLNNPKIKILDTRKTTPLLRELEKKAVQAGGAHNHRYSLSDMVLIKENHISGFLKHNPISELPNLFRKFKAQTPNIKIEIEIETIDQLNSYDLKDVDYIMFDNFTIPQIEEGIKICRQKKYKAEIEISGNINLETIANYSNLEIHRISVGSLTHSVKALDLSLLFK
jgi:nicotinate-nucleotide pyrophosphorylase (carboxylating)